MNLLGLLENGLFALGQVLRFPVMALLWVCVAAALFASGRVLADWPGLKPADLYEARDLKATTDVRAVLKGVLKDHLRLDATALASKVFPMSQAAKPMPGLVVSA